MIHTFTFIGGEIESIPLTLDILRNNFINFDSSYYYHEVFDLLIAEDYKYLGCLNDNIKLPDIPFDTQGRNWSGSSTIMVSHKFRVFYTVDMGD